MFVWVSLKVVWSTPQWHSFPSSHQAWTFNPGILWHCPSTVGWSDLALVSIFENLHISTFLLNRYIFRNSIPKNRQFRPHARPSHARQSFHFQKITGTLKINIFLKTCRHLPNTSKNNLQKENLKKICLIFLFIF